MNARISFINNTIKAGIFFIIPFAVVIILLFKVMGLLSPISKFIESVADPDGVIPHFSNIVTILLLIFIFFLGGILEKRFAGSAKIASWLEDHILSMIPGYELIKNSTKQNIGLEVAMSLKVVLVPADGWVLAFQVEELANDETLVFIPASPNPYEGSLNIFRKSEIRSTTLSPKDAYGILRRTGIGTRSLFDKAVIDPRAD